MKLDALMRSIGRTLSDFGWGVVSVVALPAYIAGAAMFLSVRWVCWRIRGWQT